VKVEKELQANIEEIKATVNKQKREVTVLKATEKEMEKAHKRGLTTGKYNEQKIKESKELTSKEKTNEKQIGEKAVPVSPKDPISTTQQSQSDKGLSPKNKGIENNKKTESNPVERKFIPPGQKKKAEEKQLKQKAEQKQFEQKGKKSNPKKTKSNENKKSNVKQINNNKEQKGKNKQ
jgi:hypothetical protein